MWRSLSLVACLFPLAAAVADEATDKEVKALQGEWVWMRHESGGTPMEPQPQDRAVMKIEGTKFFVKDKETGKFKEVGDFKLDVTTTPRCVDVISTDKESLGQKNEAIYKLEEDKLTVAINLNADDKTRPMEFKTAADKPGLLLIEFERKK